MREAWQSVSKWFLGWFKGGPHFVVGDSSRPYMLRWYVIPRNPICNIYIHKFLRDDDDRPRHDHPWASISIILWRGYTEDTVLGRKWYGPLSIIMRSAVHTHRIELFEGKPAWTLFLTGPIIREWGFHCPQGWKHWRDFVDKSNVGSIGRGCN